MRSPRTGGQSRPPYLTSRQLQKFATGPSALGNIEEIRTTLAEVANIDDFLEDLEAAERTLRLYLST
jgi:hypothetical protein